MVPTNEIWVHMRTYTRTHVYTHTRIYIHIYTHVYTHTYTHTYTHIRMYKRIDILTHIYMDLTEYMYNDNFNRG